MVSRVSAAAIVVLSAGFAACGGGGGSSVTGTAAAPVAVATPTIAPATPAASATGTLSITFAIPLRTGAAPAARARRPAYISTNTRSMSFYDGTKLVYVANINLAVAPPAITTIFSSGNEVRDFTCTIDADGYQASCTEKLVVSCSSHVFDAVAYPNPQTASKRGVVGGGGIILSEGELGPYSVKTGDNGNHEIVMLGVADQVAFAPIVTPYTSSNGATTIPNVGVVGVGSYTVVATIEDASGATIVLPGAYDNGPVSFAETDRAERPLVLAGVIRHAAGESGTGELHRAMRESGRGDDRGARRHQAEHELGIASHVHERELRDITARHADLPVRSERRQLAGHRPVADRNRPDVPKRPHTASEPDTGQQTALLEERYTVHYRRLATAAALVALLAGCGGGGGSTSSVPSAAIPQQLSQVTPAPPTTTSSSRASVTVAFRIPLPSKKGTSSARRPDYISSGTQSIVFYDGTTLAGVMNVNVSIPSPTATIVYSGGTIGISNVSCTAGTTADTCQATVTTTVGSHTFGMVAYDQPVSTSSPSPVPSTKPTSVRRAPDALYGGGIILSEGQVGPLTLQPGPNPGATITLNGVAFGALMPIITTPYTYNTGDGTVANVGVVGVGTYTGSITIQDAAGQTITTPGTYDNGPVVVSEQDSNGILSIKNGSYATPPSTASSESYTVSCLKVGFATIQATAGTAPDTTYASHIVYSSSNYATSPIQTQSFECVANSASIPITGQ